MATRIRPEISTQNKYWIDKHRYYELKHFCLQYIYWKNLYTALSNPDIPLSMIEHNPTDNTPGDPTGKRAVMLAYYKERIDLIEQTAIDADECLHEYILKAVTKGLPYSHLKTKLDIPCGKDMYYDRYRKFFWLLSQKRD